MGRIVVIDEDKHIRQLYEAEFSESGYEVLPLATGSELMAKLELFRPDLIILDIKFGDFDGLWLLQKIRTLASRIPVVVCSVYDFSRRDTGPLSTDCFVLKSFDLTGLKAKVEQVIKARSRLLKAV
ncbi:MAG: response regulator [Syntrophobacteraceae bacterium]